jgi:hypothetical protein
MFATKASAAVVGFLAAAAVIIGFVEGQTVWLGSAVALAIMAAGFLAADRALILLADIRDRLPAPKQAAAKKADPIDDIPPQFRD